MPKIDFCRPLIDGNDVAAVVSVLESGWITTGSECAAFEEELREYLGAEHVVVCSSATAAEEIILSYLGENAGLRIGVPSWTFASSALAIHRTGHVPVLLDVDRDDLNLSVDSVQQAIDGQGLDALVGVHIAGNPMNPLIRSVCAEHGVTFIEDAAHALGTSDDRGLIRGSHETLAAFFSFYATKNLPTGEGGAIATNDPKLAHFARRFRLHGMSADASNRYAKPGAHGYDIQLAGIKANMPDVLATLGRSQLRRFPEGQRRRRELVERYRYNLRNTGAHLVPDQRHPGSSDHLMMIDCGDLDMRNHVIASLASAEIGSSVHFIPLHRFSWFVDNDIQVGEGGLKVTEEMYGRMCSLPLHLGLSDEDVDRVCQVVSDCFGPSLDPRDKR